MMGKDKIDGHNIQLNTVLNQAKPWIGWIRIIKIIKGQR